MQVGIDTFSIRELELSPIQTLDWIKEHGFAGAQWGTLEGLSPTLDMKELEDIQAHASSLGLYSHASLPNCNIHQVATPRGEYISMLEKQIEMSAKCGWLELHTVLGGGDERYLNGTPWTEQLADAALFMRALAPALRNNAVRVNFETHGDVSTFELIRLIEDVGPDIAGICLDTANLFCQCENPVRAVKRAAPYVHLTHIKDAMILLHETGYRRQTLPPGRGVLPWETILPILAEYEPNLPLSIEDHKWLFDFHAFDPHWLRLHPDLTLVEYSEVMKIAWMCGQRVFDGTLPDPKTYDSIPYLDEHEDRLHAGRDHLNSIIERFQLQNIPGLKRRYQSLGMTIKE